MAGAWRGFGRERYGLAKAGIAAASVAGFASLWAALSAAHDPAPDDLPVVPTAGATPTATATSILGSATLVPVPTAAVTPRSRSSRAS